MPERIDLEHELSDSLREVLRDETRAVGTLYNALQDLDDETFADRFGSVLVAFRDALEATDAEFVITVIGIDIATDPMDVGEAHLLSIHAPNDDGSVDELLYTGDEGVPDTVVMLPVRPADCPPGSGNHASNIDIGAFREIVSAMVFKRFDLLQNNLDGYRDSYLRPTVRGLEAYQDANDY